MATFGDIHIRRLAIFALAIGCAGGVPAAAQVTATINIDSSTKQPVHPGFSGFNDEVSTPVEYYDYRFNALAAQLSPGWIRFPGGISSQPYNWKTGEEVPDWVTGFVEAAGTPKDIANLLQQMQLYLAGKGGGKFIDSANRANLLGARLVVCVNAFNDTPLSIYELALYAKANGIPVAVWELANEAYYYTPGFFKSGADYVFKMRPYYDAIKAVDPNATVAIFFDDAGDGKSKSAWDESIASYPDKYWDAVTYHQYPPRSSGTNINQWMWDENAVLATATARRVTNYLAPMNPPGTRFLVTEFDPSLGSGLPPASLTNGTLYGGIYVAEYTMRMSTIPSVMLVGSHALPATGGVDAPNFYYGVVREAAQNGTPIDTMSLDFNFYISAQGSGAAIVNGVLKNAAESYKTGLSGGVTVRATGVGGIPALHAQAYSDATGKMSVVITNKSVTTHQVRIIVDGKEPDGGFPIQFITGTRPDTVNSADNPNAVAIQSATSGNPVTVPPFSVLRVDLNNPAVATFVNAASHEPGPVAPAQLVTGSGSGFASGPMQAQQPAATLADTSILITDRAGKVWTAPIYGLANDTATFLVPDGVADGPASVQVMRSGTKVLSGSLTVAAVSPGLYAANGNGAGVANAVAALVGPDGTTNPPVYACQPNIPLSCLSTPLALGDETDALYVFLGGTGIRGGKSVQAYVAGWPVPVLSYGPQQQYAGLDQVDVLVPRSLAATGEASVYVVVDGKMSNRVSVNIQ